MSNLVPVDSTRFDLNDTTLYRWKIWNPNRNAAQMVFLLIFLAFVIPAIPFSGLWLVSFASTTVANWLAWIFVGGAILLIGVFLCKRLGGASREETHKDTGGMIAIATFSLGAVHYLLAYTQTDLGFRGTEGVTAWGWIIFLLDNFLGVVLLDIPDVYGWHITGIRPETNFACALTVIVRVLMTIGAVEMILYVYRVEMSEEEFFGTVRECVHHCDAILGPDDLVLMRTGVVQQREDAYTVRVPEFIAKLKPGTGES